MDYPTDRDGKSKTASAVDQPRYPEQNETREEEQKGPERQPTRDQIFQRAKQIWQASNCQGSPEDYLRNAEEALRAEHNSRGTRTSSNLESGSVQR